MFMDLLESLGSSDFPFIFIFLPVAEGGTLCFTTEVMSVPTKPTSVSEETYEIHLSLHISEVCNTLQQNADSCHSCLISV